MNAPLKGNARELDLAKFLSEQVWYPNTKDQDTALCAAMVGHAPTIGPEHLSGQHAHALEVFQREGRAGLIRWRLTGFVAPLLERYATETGPIFTALELAHRCQARRQAAAAAIASHARLLRALTALSRLR